MPGQRGFTYFMLLWWVALSGLVLAAVAQNWRFERQREREIEMVARAEEIRAAIESYHRRAIGALPPAWPMRLNDLVEDRRGPTPVRHLRRLWVDPLTGVASWGLIHERAAEAASAASAASAPGEGQQVASQGFAAPAFSAPTFAASGVSPGGSGKGLGIRGVYSLATSAPVRAPTGIQAYAQWRFEAREQTTGP